MSRWKVGRGLRCAEILILILIRLAGCILCRLSPDSPALGKLALRLCQAISTRDSSVWLLGIPHGKYAGLDRRSHLDIYRNITRLGSTDPFRLPISFQLLGRSTRAKIYLSLTGTDTDSVLISGFPRRMGESLAIPTTCESLTLERSSYRLTGCLRSWPCGSQRWQPGNIHR